MEKEKHMKCRHTRGKRKRNRYVLSKYFWASSLIFRKGSIAYLSPQLTQKLKAVLGVSGMKPVHLGHKKLSSISWKIYLKISLKIQFVSIEISTKFLLRYIFFLQGKEKTKTTILTTSLDWSMQTTHLHSKWYKLRQAICRCSLLIPR